jgi:hypothetical protein
VIITFLILFFFPLATQEELSEFLREILPRFLQVVDPMESGLVDVMYGSCLLTDTDNESLCGKDVNTRKEQVLPTEKYSVRSKMIFFNVHRN